MLLDWLISGGLNSKDVPDLGVIDLKKHLLLGPAQRALPVQ